MSNLKVGDKVRCISGHGHLLVQDQMYEVTRIETDDNECIQVKGSSIWWMTKRFELVVEENRHVHHDLIIAWAKGAKIQCLAPRGTSWSGPEWTDTKSPSWLTDWEYRIKPEPKPDIVTSAKVFREGNTTLYSTIHQKNNVKFTFDGETNVLKSVELIKE